MANFNKVFLMGNLTRDPELKYLAKGTAVATFGMAINRTWRTETGEVKEEVTFVDVEAFARTAENISQYLRKGSPLFVEGRLKLDTWEDKQTQQKRSKMRVIAEMIQFIGAPRGGEAQGGGGGGDAPPPQSQAPSQAPYQPRPRPAAPARPPEPPHEPEVPPHEEDDVPF